MDETRPLIATVFGATGLVGKEVIQLLSDDNRYSKIIIANRHLQNYQNNKLHELEVDFNCLVNYPPLFQCDHLFICLGTTIKKAGSKERFNAVDLCIPTEIAKLGAKFKTGALILISSLGANAKSSNFYLQTKGKAEQAFFSQAHKRAYVVRPSMLFGKRKERRVGEQIGKVVLRLFAFLLVGKYSKYKGISGRKVAQAMIFILNAKPKQQLFESNDLEAIALDF